MFRNLTGKDLKIFIPLTTGKKAFVRAIAEAIENEARRSANDESQSIDAIRGTLSDISKFLETRRHLSIETRALDSIVKTLRYTVICGNSGEVRASMTSGQYDAITLIDVVDPQVVEVLLIEVQGSDINGNVIGTTSAAPLSEFIKEKEFYLFGNLSPEDIEMVPIAYIASMR